jgi:hypothetical protein
MKALLLTCAVLAIAAGPGKVFHSKEQALELAFGKKSKVTRTTQYWTEEERDRLIELAGTKDVGLTHVAYAELFEKGQADDGRRVWFDTRLVRTKQQTVMLLVDKAGTVEKLVVCSFDEPLDYKPVDRWYAQFEGKKLDDQLKLKKAIHGVSGATMTARSTTAAVREMLAADAVLRAPAPEPEPKPQR